jgi:hypothetical protein
MTGQGDGLAAVQRGSFKHILRRPVVLDKVQVGSGELPEGMPKVAHHRYGFQENFRKQHGRSDVQVNAAAMQSLNNSAEEAEILKRSLADCFA